MNNLLTHTPAEFALLPYSDASDTWLAKQSTMADAWDNCPRGDCIAWMAFHVRATDERTMRRFAIWCARSTPLADGRVTGDLLTDPRSIAALDAAERYADGQATDEELAAASLAAFRAKMELNAADEYAYATVRAACAPIGAAQPDGYLASMWASSSAAYAAGSAFPSEGMAAANLAQANQFRLMVANPFPRTEAQP